MGVNPIPEDRIRTTDQKMVLAYLFVSGDVSIRRQLQLRMNHATGRLTGVLAFRWMVKEPLEPVTVVTPWT